MYVYKIYAIYMYYICIYIQCVKYKLSYFLNMFNSISLPENTLRYFL